MALINCPECQHQISDKAGTCPHCGYPINNIPIATTNDIAPVEVNISAAQDEDYLYCPRCHSRNIHAEQKGFSGGKALVGAALVGGIGLLAGTIGSKDVRLTCMKCGYHFKSGEAYIHKKEPQVAIGIDDQITAMLKQNRLMDAALLYKDSTNSSLAEARDYVFELAKKNNIKVGDNAGTIDDTSDAGLIIVGIAVVVAFFAIILICSF